MSFFDAFSKKHLIFDGGFGTMLLAAGLPAGHSPDGWNITNPDAVRAVHAAYLAAGADVITTNTFGSNVPRQKRGKASPAELVLAGVKLAKEAIATSGKAAYVALEEAGADALGCNCGVGPEQLVALLPRFVACATKPLVMQPNAGLPEYRDGQTVYLCGPEEFAGEMKKLAVGGVWGLGGCCGTTPAHIELVSQLAKD